MKDGLPQTDNLTSEDKERPHNILPDDSNKQPQHERNKILQIVSEPIGAGKERTCYIHPEDPKKLIKISNSQSNVQTKREVDFYYTLVGRKNIQYTHLPKFYGCVKTNLGDGFVVDLILDYDNKISERLKWYLNQGYHITEFEPYLDELKNYCLQNRIIFNHDLWQGNILVQKISKNKIRLVIIDGIGDVVFFTWLNAIPPFARSKIKRRWDRFIKRMYKTGLIQKQLKEIKEHPDKYTKSLKSNL